MKRLLDLTNADLEQHPVWRYEGKTDEEATVWPVPGFEEPDRHAYIARTRFLLNDGTEHFGYCSPTDDSGLDYIQPVIVVPSGHVRFWYDHSPPHREPAHACSMLDRLPEQVFPVRYECLIPFEGQQLVGEIREVGIVYNPT